MANDDPATPDADDDDPATPGADNDDIKISEHHAAEVARFFEANAPWLFGHACLLTARDQEFTASPELAADLLQDTFEAATRDWETLRELAPAQQRKWLRTTLSHKATSSYRRRKTDRRKQPDLHHRYKAVEPDPEQQALSALALEKAAKIIEGLPGNQKKIALMKWNDHMKESEIAAALGCAPGTVASQVHEIRRKLINGLGPYYPFARDKREGEAS